MGDVVNFHLWVGDGFGSAEGDDFNSLFELEQNLIVALDRSQAGEYLGHDFQEGVYDLEFETADFEKLRSVVFPIIKQFRHFRGAYVVRRKGNRFNASATEQTYEL